MAPSIAENLSSLAAATKILNELSDKATGQLKVLDEYLTTLNIGVEMWAGKIASDTTAKNSRGQTVGGMYYLGYARDQEAQWGLVVKCVLLGRDSTDEAQAAAYGDWVRRLVTVSRELRVAAVPHVSKLLEMLTAECLRRAQTLAASAEQLDAVTRELSAALEHQAQSKKIEDSLSKKKRARDA